MTNTGRDLVTRAYQQSKDFGDSLECYLQQYRSVARNYADAGLIVPENLRFAIDYLSAAMEHDGGFPETTTTRPAGRAPLHTVPGDQGSGLQRGIVPNVEEVAVKVDPVVRKFVKYHFENKNRPALYNEMIAARQHGADFDADYIMAALHVIRGGVWVDCVCGFTPEPGDAYCGGCGRSRGKYTMEKEVAHYDALGQTVEADWLAL